MIAQIIIKWIIRYASKHRLHTTYRVGNLLFMFTMSMLLWLYGLNSIPFMVSNPPLTYLVIILLTITTAVMHLCVSKKVYLKSLNGIWQARLFDALKSSIAVFVMLETFLFVFTTIILSLVLLDILIPYMNQLSGKQVTIRGSFFSEPVMIAMEQGIIFLITISTISFLYLKKQSAKLSKRIKNDNFS